MKTIRRTGIAGLSGGFVALIMALALPRQVAHGASQTPPAPSVRDILTSMPVAPALQQAVNRYRQADPSATFTFLRGHVDAFAARPRAMVPDYARPILLKYGLSVVPTPLMEEMTSDLPNNSNRDPAEPTEDPSSEDIGLDGPPDASSGPGVTRPDPDAKKVEQLTTWYEQTGAPAVKEVLAAFLASHEDVFEVPAGPLANQLPNLRLVRYGVGKQGRRAQFDQRVGTTPVLNSKTVVWFDLNWNVIAISRQLLTDQKLTLPPGSSTTQASAVATAANAVAIRFKKTASTLNPVESDLGIDVIRAIRAWQIQLLDPKTHDIFRATLDGATNEVLNVSDDTARYKDAKVSRWNYPAGDLTNPTEVTSTDIYTHDDNTLVHDFFYIVNDDRNDSGSADLCGSTPKDTRTTAAAYGTTTSSDYIRPTRRGDRDFSLWLPGAPKASFGEAHVYFWARKYVQWQKQALVDEGVLTLGNFNNYKKALIIVNACDDGNGFTSWNYPVSTLDDIGEDLPKVVLPDRCRSGQPAFGLGNDCSSADYDSSLSGYQYTFEGNGGYHAPGVIDHELNHFLIWEYFQVPNSLDCTISNETQYFQEGGLGRTLPQMFWHHYYNVGYLPEWTAGSPDFNTDKLFQSTTDGGKPHNPDDSGSLDLLSPTSFACGTDAGDPYDWGGVVSQPMWEIYHGERVDGSNLVAMPNPAGDTVMIRSMYYAADMASASTFSDRFELANRFMEWWDLFSGAMSSTKTTWCDVWGHHGLDTFINTNYCS